MAWKPLAKRIAYWTIPPGFQTFILKQRERFSRPSLSPAMQAEFMRNRKFYNLHKGERCFILATGPSINKQDLNPLRNEICIAVSFFFLHKDIRVIDPLYHIEAPNHYPFRFESPRKLFEGYSKSYSNRTTYFFGYTPYEYSICNFLDQNPQFKKDSMYFLNYCDSQPLDEKNYDNPGIWDICKPLFSPRTVIYCAIQVAVYMGFKRIFLLGCDDDYLANWHRRRSTHFYREEEGIDDSVEWPSMEDFFLRYHLRWKQYRLMRSYLEPQGCHIYNATQGGYLEVFPRVSLREALPGNHVMVTPNSR